MERLDWPPKLSGAQVVPSHTPDTQHRAQALVFALLDFDLALAPSFSIMPTFFPYEMWMFYYMSYMLEACNSFVIGAHS